eukprot:COSAG04_NODE_1053_length_8548_cov_1599.678542_2_plen_178_part_00
MRLALLGLLAHGPLVTVRPPPASPLSRRPPCPPCRCALAHLLPSPAALGGAAEPACRARSCRSPCRRGRGRGAPRWRRRCRSPCAPLAPCAAARPARPSRLARCARSRFSCAPGVCDAQVQECETECPCAAAAGRESGASVCSAASFVLQGASARRSARLALPLPACSRVASSRTVT